MTVVQTLQDGAVAIGTGLILDVSDRPVVAVDVVIAGTATITFEGMVTGGTMRAVSATNLVTAAIATTATATGTYLVNVSGLTRFQARISTWVSGAVTAIASASAESGGALAGSLGASSTTLTAGELHLGEVAAYAIDITPTITVDTAVYAAGDTVGGIITLPNALRAAGKPAFLQGIHILDRSNQKPTGNLLFFNASPAAATTTDNAPFVYSTDDFKEVARVPIVASDYVTINSKATAHLPNLGRQMTAAASGTSLFVVFVTDGAPDFVAATDLQAIFSFM